MAKGTCSVEDCERSATHRGWCAMHYGRWYGRGTTTRLPHRGTEERFRALVDRSGGPDACWPWTGAVFTGGYGALKVEGKMRPAHRVAWELAHGPIPDGQWVLHHCDNRPCVKTDPDEQYPDGHLFLGTAADNVADMWAKERGHTGPNARTSSRPPAIAGQPGRPHPMLHIAAAIARSTLSMRRATAVLTDKPWGTWEWRTRG